MISAKIIVAGDVELAPDFSEETGDTIRRAAVVRFDTEEDLRRFLAGEPISARWLHDRETEATPA